MKFNYEVGMRVVTRHTSRYRKDSGVVTHVEDEQEIKVRWGDETEDKWAETYDLMPDTPEAHAQLVEHTKLVQAKVDEATSALENAFKAWRQANSLQQGHEEEDDYYEGAYALKQNKDLDLSKFEAAFEKAGWSASSLYC